MIEKGRTEQRTVRRWGAVVGALTLAVTMAACGGKGKVVAEGAESVSQLLREGHVPKIPRLPEVPAGIAHQNWRVLGDGRTIDRSAINGLESYDEQVTLRADAAADKEITNEDAEQIQCYAKVIVQGPGAVNELVEGRSVYQQQSGSWVLVQNELDQGFPGSPCEVVEKAIPENE
jgi:hypothetical protein